MHIKNLTNSPYSLFNAKGESVMLPARGEIDIDPHPMYATYYRQAGYFEITESPVDPTPAPATEPEATEEDPRDALREEYEELSGESADKRWSESRLRSEIYALLEE